jgi:hypothetical protein
LEKKYFLWMVTGSDLSKKKKRKDESGRQTTAQLSNTSSLILTWSFPSSLCRNQEWLCDLSPGLDLVSSWFGDSQVLQWQNYEYGLRGTRHSMCRVWGLPDSDQSPQCIWGIEKWRPWEFHSWFSHVSCAEHWWLWRFKYKEEVVVISSMSLKIRTILHICGGVKKEYISSVSALLFKQEWAACPYRRSRVLHTWVSRKEC